VRLQPPNESAHYSLMLAYRNAGRPSDAAREQAELDKLQKSPQGEFTDFLKRLGEKAPKQ
jgi:DNA-binding SARP family transcriptional activator